MNCQSCGRRLKPFYRCGPFDPAMDCGGDCATCQREFERGICDEDWADWDRHHALLNRARDELPGLTERVERNLAALRRIAGRP